MTDPTAIIYRPETDRETSLPSNGRSALSGHKGLALVWIIVTMVAVSAVGGAMVSFYAASSGDQTGTLMADQARLMAESGRRFFEAEYRNQNAETDKNRWLESVNGQTFAAAAGEDNRFKIDVTAFYYRVVRVVGNQMIMQFPGDPGFDPKAPPTGFLPGYVRIDGDDTIYQYNAAPTDDSYTFTLTAAPASAPDVFTGVYPVVQANIAAVSEGGNLVLGSAGSGYGAVFPLKNGMFLIEKEQIRDNLPVKGFVPYVYDYLDADNDTLVNVTAPPGQRRFTDIDAASPAVIQVGKFVQVKSTGTFEETAEAESIFRLAIPSRTATPGSLKSYWNFDDTSDPETAKDDYGTRDGTLVGDAQMTTTDAKVGAGALALGAGGSTGYVTTEFSPAAEIGNNRAFTVVFWAKPDSVSTIQGILGTYETNKYFFIAILQSGKWVWAYGNDFHTYDTARHPEVLPDAVAGQWQHVAWQYDGEDIVIYINGREKYRTEYLGAGEISSIDIDIGALAYGTSDRYQYAGLLDEVAVFDRALDICEIREIYDVLCNVGCGVFNTANDPGVSPAAWLPFNGNSADESGELKDGNPPDNNPATAVNEAALAQDRFGCQDKAYSLDGADDYLYADHSDSLEMSDVDKVTVAVWIKKDQLYDTNQWRAIVQKSDDSYNLQLNYGKPVFTIRDSVTYRTADSNTVLPVGVWYHLVGTFDSTAGADNVKIYIDGVLKGTATADSIAGATGQVLGMGYNSEQSGRNFDGSIDDISIWDIALSPAQVADYYDQTSHK